MLNDIRPPARPRPGIQIKPDNGLKTATSPTATTDSTPFRTPEAVAATQSLVTAPENKQPAGPAAGPVTAAASGKAGWRQKLALHWPPGRKEWLTAGVIVLLIGGVITGLVVTHHPAKPLARVVKPHKIVPKVVKPTIVPSTLTGLPVAPSVNQQPVTGVMIENSLDARPQSGLGQAGVVFEAVAEGGVTRFLALFQDTAPGDVGPIRSARPYYIQWDMGFDGAYAHVGGSPDGLADIKTWGVKDLDEFANAGSYHRIATRQAPHNVYTAIATLNQLEASKGYGTSTFTGFPRKKETPVKVPTASAINLSLSGPVYNPTFNYQATTNSYLRSEDGAAHIDANTNQQIAPKVVIAMVVPKAQGALDSSGAYYSDYAAVGSGPVSVFQDGTVTTGQWSKPSNTAQISFTDAKGQVIKLNPGQTWLTAVATPSGVTYTP